MACVNPLITWNWCFYLREYQFSGKKFVFLSQHHNQNRLMSEGVFPSIFSINQSILWINLMISSYSCPQCPEAFLQHGIRRRKPHVPMSRLQALLLELKYLSQKVFHLYQVVEHVSAFCFLCNAVALMCYWHRRNDASLSSSCRVSGPERE